MVYRTQKLHKNKSLFLFGARGTGKTTLLRQRFGKKNTLWIDLLKDEDESRFGRQPDELSQVLASGHYSTVVIDEVQKAPKILDVVHSEMEKHKSIQFVLTGSSARKLKRGAANLLAGRAFTYNLFPLTTEELDQQFDLNEALHFGTLPRLLELSGSDDKNEFLRAYVKTYIREEIQIEQVVRRLNPFRDFLAISAQTNGKTINFSKIARDTGVDDKTIHSYFSILEDTHLGFLLPSFHRSVRKQQRESPKFYFFDPGVIRALNDTLRVELVPHTYAFGNAFEHWVILESIRKNAYYKSDHRFSYLMTKDGAEIDLIVQRPGKPELLIEIKSNNKISKEDTSTLQKLAHDWDQKCTPQVWSRDPSEKKIGNVSCLHWQEGLKQL